MIISDNDISGYAMSVSIELDSENQEEPKLYDYVQKDILTAFMNFSHYLFRKAFQSMDCCYRYVNRDGWDEAVKDFRGYYVCDPRLEVPSLNLEVQRYFKLDREDTPKEIKNFQDIPCIITFEFPEKTSPCTFEYFKPVVRSYTDYTKNLSNGFNIYGGKQQLEMILKNSRTILDELTVTNECPEEFSELLKISRELNKEESRRNKR